MNYPVSEVNDALRSILSEARDIFGDHRAVVLAAIFAAVAPPLLARVKPAREAVWTSYDAVHRQIQKFGKGARMDGKYLGAVQQPGKLKPKLKVVIELKQWGNRIWGKGLVKCPTAVRGIPRLMPIILRGTIYPNGRAELEYWPADPTNEGRGKIFLKVDKYTGRAEGNFSGLSMRDQEPVYGSFKLRKVRLTGLKQPILLGGSFFRGFFKSFGVPKRYLRSAPLQDRSSSQNLQPGFHLATGLTQTS